MKTIVVLTAAIAAASLVTARADILGDWTFESSLPATAGPFSPEVGSGSALGSHVGATVYSSPSGNGSTHSFSSTLWAVGDYYQFQVSTLGFSGVTLSFDQTSSSTGPSQFKLSYSTDGSTFTDFTTYSPLINGAPNTAWTPSTYNSVFTISDDLSAISALNNQATVFFRLVDNGTVSEGGNGGVVATGGTDRVDNFVVSAAPVPEPASLALGLFGGFAWLVALRRKR